MRKWIACALAAATTLGVAACGITDDTILEGGDPNSSPYGYSVPDAMEKIDKNLGRQGMSVKSWTAIQQYQAKHKLTVNGTIDPATWKSLGFDDWMVEDMKERVDQKALRWQPCSTVIVREVNEGLDGSQRWALERVLADMGQITGLKFVRNLGNAAIPPNPLPSPARPEITFAWVQPGGSDVLNSSDAAASWMSVKGNRITGGAGLLSVPTMEGKDKFGGGSTYAVLLRMMMSMLGTGGKDGIIIRSSEGLSGTISRENIAALQKLYGTPKARGC